MLPKRIKREKFGTERAAQRVWQRHRRYVRTHHCCVTACFRQPIEFAHVRSAANSGTGLKPPDWMGVSLCHDHHAEQHRIGIQSFEKKYNVDLSEMAGHFARRSPDLAMREAMRESMRSAGDR